MGPLVYTVNYASKKWGEGLKQGKLNGRDGKNEKERYSWQWAKQALLYLDLLHSLKCVFLNIFVLIYLGSEQWGPSFLRPQNPTAADEKAKLQVVFSW